MQIRNLAAMAAIIAASSPCLAGGEPSPPYYPAPAPYYYAPPVIVTAPPPNPLAAVGVGIGGLVGGALAIPGVVLGGLFGAIAPPAATLCVLPDSILVPCPAGPPPVYPAYPPPAYEPPPPAYTEPGYYLPPTTRCLANTMSGRPGSPGCWSR
jgi:hypothetical protein